MTRTTTPEYRRAVQLLPTMNDTMIAREVNLSRERVRQIRNEHGIESLVKNRRCDPNWNEDKLAKLCKMDLSQYTQAEVAKELGVAKWTLKKKCKEVGVDYSVCINEGKARGLKLYPTEMLLDLYDKHEGNILQISKLFVGKQYSTLNAATVAFTRRYKKLGLTGKGEKFGGSPGAPEKYTYDMLQPLWDKHRGNLSAISRELKAPLGSIHYACVRHGLHKSAIKIRH